MRQNLVVALLSIACTLLAVNFLVELREPQIPIAYGQAVGTPSGQTILATGMNQSGNEAVLYLYDVGSQSLACYTTRGQGIELKGTRRVTWDLKAQEFKGTKSPTVAEMKKATEKE